MEDLKENDWGLRRASIQDSSLLADLIAASFHDVAKRFGLGRDNCPSHPSLITSDRVERGFRLGTEFLLAFKRACPCGCVGLRRPAEGVSTMEKLAVAPAFRRRGLGRVLVREAFFVAQRAGATHVEIGIIARQQELRAWYESMGFRAVRNAQFERLPFEVLFLQKALGGESEA